MKELPTFSVTFLITYLAIVCCEGFRRKHPINLIAAGLLVGGVSRQSANFLQHSVL